MTDEKKESSAKLISNYFGKLPGQNLADFMSEFKALSSEEKEQLAEGIRNGSLTY